MDYLNKSIENRSHINCLSWQHKHSVKLILSIGYAALESFLSAQISQAYVSEMGEDQDDPSANLQLRHERPTYDKKKKTGASYTPTGLAYFVAQQIVNDLTLSQSHTIRVLDPAVGDGELLIAITDVLRSKGYLNVEVYGFDTNPDALEIAGTRFKEIFCNIPLNLQHEDFLDHVLKNFSAVSGQKGLFQTDLTDRFDLVIANPPYVRTQVLGSEKSKLLAQQFGLKGRVDLYHAFILAISNVLHEGGGLGIIVSNRFMTTRSGVSARECFLTKYTLTHIFDLGDSKLFEEAVLPAVVVAKRSMNSSDYIPPTFAKCYASESSNDTTYFESVLDALEQSFSGCISVSDTQFKVTQGILDHGSQSSGVWRVKTPESDVWLSKVESHQYCRFKDIGKIRVGVKTTSDKVFIRNNWNSLPADKIPEDEVLLPLITHKQASRWISKTVDEPPKILYTHKLVNQKRCPIELEDYPCAARYLEHNRLVLESRKYVINAGRKWYEVWVPHNPEAWRHLKVVFRDISEINTFFMDKDGAVINGDCYWLTATEHKNEYLLWLALAVGNSSFILKFYDEKFCNKLYSNRRRFMTQYVEEFPIPDPDSEYGKELIKGSKKMYSLLKSGEVEKAHVLEKRMDNLVWCSFGLIKE